MYHPEQAAHWNCVTCGSLVCQDCFPAAPDPVRPPYCTLCSGNMHYLGAAHALPPYWQQMPRFFLYPFSPNGALFLALLAVLAIVSASIFSPDSILVLLPVFIIGSLVIRQGLRVIEFCSQGRSRPPSIGELFDGNPATFKMIGLMLAYGFLVGTLARFGVFGIVAVVGISSMLPASIMLLAIHGSLQEALNPGQIMGLVARTGWSYLGLVLVLIVTAQGPEQAISLLPDTTLESLAEHSPQVLMALLVVSTAYFNMVMGAMMGYLLFRHHLDLGIQAGDEHAAAPADPRALELARAVILVREARYADAVRQMAGMAADYPKDIGVLEYYHKLLCESGGEAERVAGLTERYLQALLDTGRKGRMAAALDAARRVVPHYQPKSIALRRAVAEELFNGRQYKAAIALIGMLHKEAPTSDEVPAAYYLLARIYFEGLRDDTKALMMLDFVLRQFPGHALITEITNYRKVIMSLRTANQAAAVPG